MKTFALLCLVVVLCGCSMTKTTIIRLEAAELKVPLGSVVPVEGTDIKLQMHRTVTISSGREKDD